MYREIVTRAVVGKGRLFNTSEAIVKPDQNPSKVLGCWIINHYYVSSIEENKIMAKGKYDLHIWYGFNNDTDTFVHKQTIDYIEEYSVRMKNGEILSVDQELITKSIKYPTCNSLSLNDDGQISVKIEKELAVDVIGEATLRVQVTQMDEAWTQGEDIDSVDVDYLNK